MGKGGRGERQHRHWRYVEIPREHESIGMGLMFNMWPGLTLTLLVWGT